ncbi:hypothetical protein LB505_007554 [Fusarium chuoi]|nr:hypothetical protein LB505_007554 [Fusarium chuoi]
MPSATPPKSDKVKKRPKVRGNYIRDPYLLSQWGLTELSGCYQCSRRRIDCDRTEPTCGKCSAKGIKCSGLGLRYRFNDGIAALSNNIAQLIAVINMGFNGYRDLVLPRAETDPLVRKAVLLVVEQHLSLQNGTAISLDPAAYGSLVRELIMRSHQCAPQDDDSALTALLLLHIREMISGSDNFRLIYGSLRVVVNALAKNVGEGTSDLRRFLQMQILR